MFPVIYKMKPNCLFPISTERVPEFHPQANRWFLSGEGADWYFIDGKENSLRIGKCLNSILIPGATHRLVVEYTLTFESSEEKNDYLLAGVLFGRIEPLWGEFLAERSEPVAETSEAVTQGEQFWADNFPGFLAARRIKRFSGVAIDKPNQKE